MQAKKMLLNIEEEQTLDRTIVEQLSRIVEFLLNLED